jgi:hypothetical protein
MAKNVFNEASKEAGGVKSKGTKNPKEEKKEPVTVIISDKEVDKFSTSLDSLVSKKKDMKKLGADLKPLDDLVRKASLNAWIKLIKDGDGDRPISIKVVGENSTSSITFTSADAYKSVKVEKANTLKEVYGDDVITESDTFSFDPAMLKKYNVLFSKFILQSPDIADEDRSGIIVCDKTYSVTPGIIDRLKELAKATKKDVSDVIADFGPTFQIQ